MFLKATKHLMPGNRVSVRPRSAPFLPLKAISRLRLAPADL